MTTVRRQRGYAWCRCQTSPRRITLSICWRATSPPSGLVTRIERLRLVGVDLLERTGCEAFLSLSCPPRSQSPLHRRRCLNSSTARPLRGPRRPYGPRHETSRTLMGVRLSGMCSRHHKSGTGGVESQDIPDSCRVRWRTPSARGRWTGSDVGGCHLLVLSSPPSSSKAVVSPRSPRPTTWPVRGSMNLSPVTAPRATRHSSHGHGDRGRALGRH